MHGEVPYRDFFEYIAPGAIYLAGLFFSVLGTSLWVAKAMAILSASGIVFFTASISERLMKTRAYSLVPPLLTLFLSFPSWPFYSYEWWGVLFALMALRGLLAANKSPVWYAVSGLCSAISILFVQHRGGLAALSLVTAILLGGMLFKRERKRLIRGPALFLIGLLVPLTAYVLYLFHTSSLRPFIADAFVWIFHEFLRFTRY